MNEIMKKRGIRKESNVYINSTLLNKHWGKGTETEIFLVLNSETNM